MSLEEGVTYTITLFAHFLDDGRYDDLAGLLTDDVVLVVGKRTVEGRAAVVESIKKAQPRTPGKHFTGPSTVSVLPSGEALAWTEMMVLAAGEHGYAIPYIGRYHDSLRRDSDTGHWRIARRALIAPGENPGEFSGQREPSF